MERSSSTTQRRKQDSSVKSGSDTHQMTTRTRQKRGSTSQTPISLVDCSEDSNQCNGLSTSINQTPKSRSASVLSSSEPLVSGGQRRSARLSQMESQQTLQTPEKKKKKSDEYKTPGKDKRKGKLDQITEEQGSEIYVSNRRTPGKSKKNTSEITSKNEKSGDEEEGGGGEPAEKKAKRAARRSARRESAMLEGSSQDEKLAEKEGEAEMNSDVTNKSSKKRSSKKKLCEPSSPDNDYQNAEENLLKQDSAKHEQTPKTSKRKKSVVSMMSSTIENNSVSEECMKHDEESAKRSKIFNAEDKIEDEVQIKKDDTDVQENECSMKIEKSSDCTSIIGRIEQIAFKAGNSPRGSPETSNAETQNTKMKFGTSESPQSFKGERVSKEFTSPKVNNVSLSKDDLVQEYNRSISEKISLLKPKAFVGRLSASFRKTIDDHYDGSGQEVDSDAESRRAIMESAQRRIEQNLSTSESDSRLFRGIHTPMAHSSKNDSSESDSAPEAVSFNSARQDALDSIKSATEHVKREKQRLKERRKARLEMLKQQKEEKLIRLKEKMASQEDASCSSSEESGYEEEIRNARQKLKKKKAKNKTQRTEKENLDDAAGQATSKPLSGGASEDSSEEDVVAAKEASSLSSLKRVQKEMFQAAVDAVSAKMQKVGNSSNNRPFQEDKLKKKKSKSGRIEESDKKDRGFKSLTSLDYIPLSTEGATKFMVVPLDKAMRAPKTLAEEAADFRQNMLYGSRVNREPGKVVAAYQQKLVASGKNFHVR